MTSHFRTVSASALVVLISLFVAGCAPSMSGSHSPQPIVPSAVLRGAQARGNESSSVPTGHLYTTDGGDVIAYPLVNGFPTASGAVTLHTPLAADLVQIGPAGMIYVVATWRLEGRVYQYKTFVYPAGSTGRPHPERTFWSNTGPGMNVDVNGNVYEGGYRLNNSPLGANYIAKAFSPTAHGEAQALHVFNAGDLATGFDAKGNVYFDGGKFSGKYVTVFANPLTQPTRIARFCWVTKDAPSVAMAVAPDGTTYVATDDYGGSKPEPGRILVFAPGEHHCPARPIRAIGATDVPFSTIVGVALSGPYLYVKDYGGYIVTMDPTKGPQVPLARLKTTYEAEGNLAIGP